MSPGPPFAGLRVLEIGDGIALRTAGMLLADLGADVVRLGGAAPAGLSAPGPLCWDRGKTLARGVPAGADSTDPSVRRLLERADAVLVDATPAALHRRGLQAEAVALVNPAASHVWLPPVATSGRWAELPESGLLLDAISGFAAHHPATRDVPVAQVVPTRLHLHGAIGAAAAAAALVARDRDGWGRAATVTGLQAVGAALCTLITKAVDGPAVISPGKSLAGGPNFRMYQDRDGRWLFLAALSPELFLRALDVLDCMEVMVRDDVMGEFANVLRPGVGEQVTERLAGVFATRTTDEWLVIFGEAGIPIAALGLPEEWLEGGLVAHASPPVRRRHPVLGEIVMPGSPVAFESATVSVGVPGGSVAEISDIWTDIGSLPPPTAPRPSDDRPLVGLRVIDTSTFLAAPFISALFAEQGAEVVKVESVTGDPYQAFPGAYSVANQHKRRLRVDLRDDAERVRFFDLVSRADIVVDNLLPASLERLGLAHEAFLEANPDVIRCSVTAFGQSGPWAELPGFDPLLQSMSGLATVQGGADRPITTGAPVHDVTTGALGALGALAALHQRSRGGAGQRVFTSLAAASTLLQSGELTSYEGRPARSVGGPDFAGPTPWNRYYRARDGWLAVDADAMALCEALGRPELAVLDAADSAAAIEEIFAADDASVWADHLAAADVPACVVTPMFGLDDAFLVEQRYAGIVESPASGRFLVINGFTDWRGAERLPQIAAEAWLVDPATIDALFR